MKNLQEPHNKKVYFFAHSKADGDASLHNLLGGKGAGLSEMTRLGIPVPPGFTIITQECLSYLERNQTLSPDLKEEVLGNLKKIETCMGKKFGDSQNPLLVSVRSGAAVSMPGMMETILNLGLNDETVLGLAEASQNPRFAYDSYRRFLQMFGNVVMGVSSEVFEELISHRKRLRHIQKDTELSAGDLKELSSLFKLEIKKNTHREFPQNVYEQLWQAIMAVFNSWNLHKAVSYRKIHKISDDLGTAVTVQTMVFGNMGEDSATGVTFTRNPSTGEKRLCGEFLLNAQGEDVVAGIRTPLPLTIADKLEFNQKSLEETLPESFTELVHVQEKLEKHYRDMQDIEFTIEKKKLYLLQTRTAKRTAEAAIKVAVDMVQEGLIDRKTAVLRVTPSQMNQLLHPRIDPLAHKILLARGLAASPGAVSGKIVLNPDQAMELAQNGEKCILVRKETSPEDIHGMNAALGILTAMGGMTSHAAVVARGMGKACVVGCSALSIEEETRTIKIGDRVLEEGEIITMDGSIGEIYLGLVPTIEAEVGHTFQTFMSWADAFRKMKVRANADTPLDAKKALDFGAEGIGLCRTEHMFFDENRIRVVRQMILSNSRQEREAALVKILPYQKEDFLGIFRIMNGLPVTVRLLDPPLHEFLPKEREGLEKVALDLNISVENVLKRVEALHEFNPMLGHRGCRLGISYPEIYAIQTQAIMEALCELKKNNIDVKPEIMIPLISDVKEYEIIEKDIRKICNEIIETYGVEVHYLVGTMIELPRAALTASLIAQKADFFSFGTNDLTQTTLGLSRDDAASFLSEYVEKNIYKEDPFVSLDIDGVGRLIQISVKEGRTANASLKVGVCGEHGGDPKSVTFFYENNFDYVSCSPYRVPVARLAAAHAALNKG